jgi:predicted nucleic acid-binding Zn ribbon protein
MTVSNKKKSIVRSETPVRRRAEGAGPGAGGCCPEKCPGCGNTLEPEYAFCPHCGKSLKKTCPVCGKPVEGGWKVCPSCGANVDSGEVRQV